MKHALTFLFEIFSEYDTKNTTVIFKGYRKTVHRNALERTLRAMCPTPTVWHTARASAIDSRAKQPIDVKTRNRCYFIIITTRRDSRG